MTNFIGKQTIYRDGAEFQIGRVTANIVQLENIYTGEFSTHDVRALLKEYTLGILYTAPKKVHRHKQSDDAPNSCPSSANMSNTARIEFRRHVDYITRLEDQAAFFGSKENLINAITEISRSRNEDRPPHVTTVYRWRSKFLKAKKDICALFSKIEMRGGKNGFRLASEVEVIIHEKIESVYFSNKCGSAEEVYDAVFLAIQLANTTRIESEWLQVPGFRTIQRRINSLYGFDIAVARYGLKEAERQYGAIFASRRVKKILELVEIDHTPVDLMVVNEERVVIGRPTITFVFDRYSRCVLGYHLSLAGHGTPAVFEALRHALMPKTYIEDVYPDLGLTWECFGWIERLLMDNGREFHADAVVDALLNLGIVTEFAGSREPNDKPFVERFNRTFNYSFIHRLPGTTLAKLEKRIGFKAEDDACITLAELDRLIHTWILGVYHLRPHFGLGKRAPIDVWRESASVHPPQLKANAEDVEIEFAEIANSAVQHYGIDLNTFRYASVRLANLRRMLPMKKCHVDVKWPRNDAGHIHVWDPFEKEYFKVMNVDPDVVGLTVEQAKAAKKFIKSSDQHKRVRAESAAVVREMANDADADKKLKNRRKGARFANQTSKSMRQSAPKPIKESVVEEQRVNSAEPQVNGFAVDSMITKGEI